MIKIFTTGKTIYLTDTQPASKNKIHLEHIRSAGEMQKKYNELVQDKKNSIDVYFFNKNLPLLFDYFSSMFHIIEAAGGLVRNPKGEWLFIFRNGKWDLPKGKIEKGEAVKEAAIREVEEECGISGLNIIRELPRTYHTYYINEKAILKCTYWFEMECTNISRLIPQTEEGITDVQWIPVRNFKQVLDNTYESIKEVLKEVENR